MKTPTIKYIHIPIRIYPLDLKEFKVYVDKSRFQQGHKIFKEDKVADLKVEKGRGKALVNDNQLYHINFQLHQHGSNVCCSCEAFQDWELLCPHLVASILYLNKGEPDEDEAEVVLQKDLENNRPTITLAKSMEKWMSVKFLTNDLTGELGHSHGATPFEIVFRREETPIATVHLSTEYVPELLRDRRSIMDLIVPKDMDKYRVLREKDVRPLLEAKLSRANVLQLTPFFEVNDSQTGLTRYKWDVLKKHRLGKSWIKWRNSFVPIPTIDATLTPFFNGKKPLVYSADEIPAFLLEELPLLKDLSEFEASSQIMEAKVIRHAPIQLQLTAMEEGWFQLNPRYGNEEYSVSLKDLLEQERSNKNGDCYIKQGHVWYELQKPLFRSLRKYFHENHGDENEQKKFKVPELLHALEDMESTIEGVKFGFSGDENILNFLKGDLTTQNYPVPKTLKGTLRPYQVEGYRWLRQLYDWGLCGILADDMGLGKTHQALALLCAIEPKRDPKKSTLIICPTSVLHHWEIKLKTFAPTLSYCVFHNNEREKLFQEKERPAVILTTYGLLGRDPLLIEQNWLMAILDEAQKIKNPSTQVSKKARLLKCDYRLALTGTPIENRLEELWTIFDFLMPNYLGSLKEFNSKYDNHTKTEKDDHQELLRKIRPFKVRRVKSQVLSDLPEKIENKRYVDLTPKQIELYRSVLHERGEDLKKKIMRAKGNKEIPYMHIFSVLTKLKQICDHPKLLGAKTGSSGKYDLIVEMLQHYLEEGKKVVIFSHFVKMIDVFEKYFDKNKINYRTLTGSTRDRTTVIKEFQEDPKVQVFLCSLLAGGLGIDLTACETVFHYDRWWNAAREDQATDRVHRIGQTRGVMVHKLITRGTLEEKIDSMITEKKNLANSIIEMDDGSHLAKFSREQLIELLSLDDFITEEGEEDDSSES